MVFARALLLLPSFACSGRGGRGLVSAKVGTQSPWVSGLVITRQAAHTRSWANARVAPGDNPSLVSIHRLDSVVSSATPDDDWGGCIQLGILDHL